MYRLITPPNDQAVRTNQRYDQIIKFVRFMTLEKLTEQQRTSWNVDGYLKLEQVFNSDEVSFFNDELDRIRQEPGWEPVRDPKMPIGHYGWLPHADDVSAEGFMDRRDLLPYGKSFVDLVYHTLVFDLVVDIMGPNILLSMTQAIVRASRDKFPGYTHTDGGEGLRQIRVTETSLPLAIKAMYLLTDVEEPDSGNLTVFPGSHMRPFPFDANPPITPYSPGAAQLSGKAGDCFLFSHALWHGPSQNRSENPRKTLLYNYCQLFLRQYDFEVTPKIKEQCTPRQLRLMGDLGYDFRPGSYFYVPLDQSEIIGTS